MENSRTPRKAPDALIDALERALAPWIELSLQRRPAAPHPSGEAPIALALSGGLDSSALLNASAELLRPLDIPLLAIYINHGLSSNAHEWARFCKIRCEVLGVQFVEVKVEVPQQASVEAAARQVRYQALAAKALELGAAVLLTAHHANDQAETVVLNLMRGSGVAGLRGIAAERRLGELVVLRPWLKFERRALLDYASKQRLSWVEDESNSDPRFRRNALRLQLMPALLEFNHDAIERLGSLARHASTSAALLDDLAAIDLDTTLKDGGLALSRLIALGRRRSANLLRYWLKQQGHGIPSESALQEWLDQLLSSSDDLQLELAGRQFTVKDKLLTALDAAPESFAPPLQVAIDWHGETALQSA